MKLKEEDNSFNHYETYTNHQTGQNYTNIQERWKRLSRKKQLKERKIDRADTKMQAMTSVNTNQSSWNRFLSMITNLRRNFRS